MDIIKFFKYAALMLVTLAILNLFLYDGAIGRGIGRIAYSRLRPKQRIKIIIICDLLLLFFSFIAVFVL